MVSLSQLSLILLSGDVTINPGPLRLGFANCCFMRNKGPLLAEEFKSGGYDVFGLTETHIKAHDTQFFLQELTPEDFTLVHTPRVNKCGGGVAFFIKKAFESKNIDRVPNFLSFKHHTISLSFHGRSLIVGALYRPLASSVQMFLEDFISYIGFLSSLSSSFVVCGDFHIHVDSVSPLVSEFKSVVDACSLTQYVDFPTHLHGHTLDLLLASMEFSSISEVHGSCFISVS